MLDNGHKTLNYQLNVVVLYSEDEVIEYEPSEDEVIEYEPIEPIQDDPIEKTRSNFEVARTQERAAGKTLETVVPP